MDDMNNAARMVNMPVLLNNPTWEGSVIVLDGARHIVLSIAQHNCLLGVKSAEALRDWLTEALEARKEGSA